MSSDRHVSFKDFRKLLAKLKKLGEEVGEKNPSDEENLRLNAAFDELAKFAETHTGNASYETKSKVLSALGQIAGFIKDIIDRRP